jgi:hypothetical protein
MIAAQLPPARLPISKTHDPFKIVGLDKRTAEGRRFKDLAAKVIAEHGPHIDPVKIRELAGLKLSIEITTAALIAGDRKARTALVRLLNHADRAQRAMAQAKRTAAASDKPPVSLEQHLRRRSGEKANAG